MSCTIKCNSCNIVIDELLSYIQNKISIADEETLVKICASTFSIEQIKKSKELLFESVPTDQRKTIRKGKGKENRVLIDIISFFKVTDPDLLPVFVARDLEKLPPILFDHLDTSKLLKDLALVRSEVDIIKSSYVSIDQLEAVKRDLLKNQYALSPFSPANINIKRGAYQDSGPIGLTNIDESAIRCYENEINVPNIDSPRFKSLNKISVDGSNQITMSKGPLVRPVSDESHNSKDCQLSDGDKTTQNKSYAIVTKSKAKPNPNEGWKLVQKKDEKEGIILKEKQGAW
ncbi:unnamed protein product [Euphydryas editha]|uniref:Mutant cadherin n=1 Tax=Euphydryas editha TaxID=104508 RepID=A0AAU9THV8_EUPED|nr:unnamed protein product [Euphydryas editha]